jgi:hypothetical protein
VVISSLEDLYLFGVDPVFVVDALRTVAGQLTFSGSKRDRRAHEPCTRTSGWHTAGHREWPAGADPGALLVKRYFST